ncbi:MAG: hypothetical protein AB7O67_18235 [Vicinamibacterales bacterium]
MTRTLALALCSTAVLLAPVAAARPQILRGPYSGTHAVRWVEPADGPPPPVTARDVDLVAFTPMPGLALTLQARTTDGSVVPPGRIVVRVGLRRGPDTFDSWTMRVLDDRPDYRVPLPAPPVRDLTDAWVSLRLRLPDGEVAPPIGFADKDWRFLAALERVEDASGEAIWSNLRVDDLLKRAKATGSSR